MQTPAVPEAKPHGPAPLDDGDAVHPEIRNWLVEGFRHSLHTFALFFRTGAQFTRHPGRFARAWARGELRAFNPLAFMATGAGLTATVGLLVERIMHPGGGFSLVDFVVGEIDPYLRYLLLGALCHAFLRLLGAWRPWYVTAGIALFAGGGPASAADILTQAITLAVHGPAARAESSTSTLLTAVVAGGVLLANAVFLMALALGLAGVHRLRMWRIALSLLAAEIALALIRVGLFKFVIPEH